MTTAEIADRIQAGDHREVAAGMGRVLDVGCSAGRLLADGYADSRLGFGADIDIDSLCTGHRAHPRLHLCGAKGEALPFAAGSFDLVMSNVAVPYMHIPTAFAEFARVLKPGGILWLTLHTAALPWGMIPRANLVGKVYFTYAILNGLLFHLTQRMVRFPNGLCESFQTEGGVSKALGRIGFTDIEFRRYKKFLVVARRGKESRSPRQEPFSHIGR